MPLSATTKTQRRKQAEKGVQNMFFILINHLRCGKVCAGASQLMKNQLEHLHCRERNATKILFSCSEPRSFSLARSVQCGIDGSQLFSPRIRYLNLRPQDRIHSLSRVWVCGRIVLSSHACIYARADVKCHQQNASCVHTLRQKAMHTRQREGERWMRCESACALKPNWERRGLGMSILGKKFNLNLLAIC